ncbi:MAG TPA: hypothetical protein VMU13_00075 [Candidatus Paceibacterota bacterium]|nr:hypothetical protein [Candidatus Paceibacterota bacterium]
MRGFSTIEILIAMGLIVSTLTAVALVSFGDQTLLADTASDAGAVMRAQTLLEVEYGNARKDFRLVENIPESLDGVYQDELVVGDYAPDPFTTKHVAAIVNWTDQAHHNHSVTLTQLITDFIDPRTLDTCDSALSGDWHVPQSTTYALTPGDLLPTTPPIGHTFSVTNPIASIDAYKGKLYVGVSKTASAGNDSLVVFDAANPTMKPRYLGSIDNNTAVIEGVSGLVVADATLYAANTHVSNFKTCKPSANCSQLQIFDVSDPTAIPQPSNFLIPTSSTPFVTGTSSSQALGNSIFYKDGYVYLGLSKTATGPEFNIIDVHDPHTPKWVGGFTIGWSINQIYVRDGYAYLATDDKSRELVILDVHDKTHPTLAATFDPTGTLGYEVGKSIYARGDDLFFGMSSATGSPELYTFSIAHPAIPLKTGHYTIGSTILDSFARDSTLFILASTIGQFQMLDISDVSAIKQYAPSLTLPGIGAGLDCEGNYFFVGSNAGTQGWVSIIGPHL